ncbi:MAG: DUF3142 domain-containing protein [Acidobacteria bacterium]|nr:DUF3142 domain-containing protein [Acidobacteriota bacterium]
MKALRAAWALPLVAFLACTPKGSPRMRAFPNLMLWAWEAPQDLRFLQGQDIGVAFYAGQLRLRGHDLDRRRRRTPLLTAPSTPLMAVVRVDGDPGDPPALDDAQLRAVLAELNGALSLPGVKGLQIDFDARLSERAFYTRLLGAFRAEHPATPLSMTALVSWCGRDGWIKDLPVDEAVPMCFRMGPEAAEIRARLSRGVDFGPDLARTSLGISLDEPWQVIPLKWRSRRRVYVFTEGAWTKDTVDRLKGALSR